VIIVGAGPVGLLVALRLGQQGVKTLVLEAHHTLLPTTRAMVYMPVVNPVLRDLGILDLVMQHAFLNTEGVAWRDPRGTLLARLPLGNGTANQDSTFEGVLLLGQAKMNGLVLQEIQKYPCVQVRFGQRVVGIEDQPGTDRVEVMTTHANVVDGDRTWWARYVLGSDGTNSAVRRALCIPFEGFTWPDFRMVGTDVVYDFVRENGWTPLNFVVDDETDAAAVVAYTGEDDPEHRGPQWRVAFLEPSNLPSSREEVLARARDRIPRYLRPSRDFTITRADVFWMHQRCARQGRKGRVMLAGDALHVSCLTKGPSPLL
jgi:2-polyprenyl-6-methoxyphenol hydroxylase-like FAD-dependent oxidoreductase